MTLIACTLNHKNPFIIGDLLISSKDAKETVHLPTITLNIDKSVDRYFPVGISQKIYIIKKNVCIALAGDVREMGILLQEFSMRCSYYDIVEKSHIDKFIEDYDWNKNFSHCSFLILLMETDKNQNNTLQVFWSPQNNWNILLNDIFEKIYASGSGNKQFLTQIEFETQNKSNSNKGEIKNAIAMNHCLIAKLLTAEKISLFTIPKNWGAGFESILYLNGEFIKFNEIAYIVFETLVDSKEKITPVSPKLLMHYKYHNGLLIITSIDIKSNNREVNAKSTRFTSNNITTNIFIAPRLDQKEQITKSDLPNDFSFNCHRMALGFGYIIKRNDIFISSVFTETDDSSVIYDGENNIVLEISGEIQKMIQNEDANILMQL